jgi:hypothetical protein
VLPVSAQKGLLAKVQGNDRLLAESRLPELELALVRRLVDTRREILTSAVAAGLGDLRSEAGRMAQMRRRDLAEQAQELRSLRGKNDLVIQQMKLRIQQEQTEFESSRVRIHALRSVHQKLLEQIFDRLQASTLKEETRRIKEALSQPGIKFGVKSVYAKTFERLLFLLQEVENLNTEIQAMLGAAFRQLNADFGFSLQLPREADLARFHRDLRLLERSHVQFLGVGNALKLAQPEFCDRLVRALLTRLRSIFDAALTEIEIWNKAASSLLDGQLRERRRNFTRRIEAIERIEQAAGGLDDRILEFEEQESRLDELQHRLASLSNGLQVNFAPTPAISPQT